MADVVTTVATVIGGGLAGGGLVAIVNAFATRRVVRVDAADRLSDAAVEWAAELKKDAADARMEAAEARRESAEARRETTEARREAVDIRAQLHAVKTELEQVFATMRRWQAAVWSPHASLEGLRVLVPQPPAANGTAGVHVDDVR